MPEKKKPSNSDGSAFRYERKLPSNLTPEEKRALTDARSNYIDLHNDLIRNRSYGAPGQARKSLTLTERRLVYYVISKVKRDDEVFEPQTFSLREFCYICGINTTSSKNWAKNLKTALDKLLSRHVWLEDKDQIKSLRWVDNVTIHKGSCTVTVTLHKDMAPYLLGLRGNYAQYPYFDVLRIKSQYGWDLYELLRSYAFMNKELRFTFPDLKDNLGCVSSAYNEFSNFRRRVLEPAVKDINTYTEMKVTYRLGKKGRAYYYIFFTVKILDDGDPEEHLEKELRYANVERDLLYAIRKEAIEIENEPNFLMDGFGDEDVEVLTFREDEVNVLPDMDAEPTKEEKAALEAAFSDDTFRTADDTPNSTPYKPPLLVDPAEGE